MTNTITYATALDIAIDTVTDKTVIEKLTTLKEQLVKCSISKTSIKVQEENEAIMVNILNALADIGKPTTVTDLIIHRVDGFPTTDGKVLTYQRASALLLQLVETGKVVMTIEGDKAWFALV